MFYHPEEGRCVRCRPKKQPFTPATAPECAAVFYETGLEGFQPHEILELLLYCVIPKRDVNPLAHALLDEFGSVDAVLSASPEALCRVPGVGRQTAEFFAALNDFSSAYRENCFHAPQNLTSLADALRYVPLSSRASLKRGLTVIFADRFGRPLAVHSFPGRPNDPAIIRGILEKTLSLHSHSAVIFCTGRHSQQPINRQELESFEPLITALIGIDSFAVDCVLLTPDHLLSLRRENLLTGIPKEIQGNLPRWECWLGPLASAESENRWYPLSMLEYY